MSNRGTSYQPKHQFHYPESDPCVRMLVKPSADFSHPYDGNWSDTEIKVTEEGERNCITVENTITLIERLKQLSASCPNTVQGGELCSDSKQLRCTSVMRNDEVTSAEACLVQFQDRRFQPTHSPLRKPTGVLAHSPSILPLLNSRGVGHVPISGHR